MTQNCSNCRWWKYDPAQTVRGTRFGRCQGPVPIVLLNLLKEMGDIQDDAIDNGLWVRENRTSAFGNKSGSGF